MSNQETNQKQIQFPAQQELKHLRTRCGKVYALGNNPMVGATVAVAVAVEEAVK